MPGSTDSLSTPHYFFDHLFDRKPERRISLSSLFEALRLEMSQGVVFDGIANFKRITAHLAVLDIGMTANREVQDHRDLFATKGTDEGVFHYATTLLQIPIA